MFTLLDKILLGKREIPTQEAEGQLEIFAKGIAPISLSAAATVNKGIERLSDEDQVNYIEKYEQHLAEGAKVLKFVPASGAATRMFKWLFQYVDEKCHNKESQITVDRATDFAFCKELDGKDDIIQELLSTEGLDYPNLPKGLIPFHRYNDQVRTPAEEHLFESIEYCKQKSGEVEIHLTVSPQHRDMFERHFDNIKKQLEQKYEVVFSISFSEQKASTDTIAVTMNNEPFRDGDQLVFRPSGHGALIENLNEQDADVIFIKNIDNVVPDYRRGATVKYKKVLAGLLVDIQNELFQYQQLLNENHYSDIRGSEIATIVRFLKERLNVQFDSSLYFMEKAELIPLLRSYVNRPVRVCGVVENTGEPGGGPFWVKQKDGTLTVQIVEIAQIDGNTEDQQAILSNATHFNPVDIVCGIRNYQGRKFDLSRFVDPETAFIAHKSHNGTEIKALERPGLWNGAMAFWNTVLVEVPLSTFAPVKTLNDLLRPEHQPE